MKIEIERTQLTYLIRFLKIVLSHREDYQLRQVLDVLELELDTGDPDVK